MVIFSTFTSAVLGSSVRMQPISPKVPLNVPTLALAEGFSYWIALDFTVLVSLSAVRHIFAPLQLAYCLGLNLSNTPTHIDVPVGLGHCILALTATDRSSAQDLVDVPSWLVESLLRRLRLPSRQRFASSRASWHSRWRGGLSVRTPRSPVKKLLDVYSVLRQPSKQARRSPTLLCSDSMLIFRNTSRRVVGLEHRLEANC